MDEKDFKNNLQAIRESIQDDYMTFDQQLRNGKYRERTNNENAAVALNYYQLSLQRRDPILPDPTLQDYENTADAVQNRKDQLEADILDDIQKEFEDKNLIEQHIEAYFYDQSSRDRAKEHIYHPVKTAFNEQSKQSISRAFLNQVGSEIQVKRDKDIDQNTFTEVEPLTEDFPEIEVHEFDPEEVVSQKDQDDYTTYPGYSPHEEEPLDFSNREGDSKSKEADQPSLLKPEDLPGYNSQLSKDFGKHADTVQYDMATGSKDSKSNPEISVGDMD